MKKKKTKLNLTLCVLYVEPKNYLKNMREHKMRDYIDFTFKVAA